jgi:hypothetical protein
MRRQISARLSDETYAQLKALTAVLRVSQAEVIARGFDALEQALDPNQQRTVDALKNPGKS